MYDRYITPLEIDMLYHEGGWMSEPSNVVIEADSLNVSISWDPVPGATSYKVYSTENAFSGFEEDIDGIPNGESWSTTLSDRKFFQVRAVR